MSFTNYDQSGRVSWLRAPVGTHDEILISVIGKKKCVGYVEKQFGGNLAYQSHGRGRNKASNEQMSVPNTALLRVNSGVWAVHKKFATHTCPSAHSPLLTII